MLWVPNKGKGALLLYRLMWALLLSHLQRLPLSSTTREKVLQYVQDKISPCILNAIQYASASGKKKDVELVPEAKAACHGSFQGKDAIVTCSLLPCVDSLWPRCWGVLVSFEEKGKKKSKTEAFFENTCTFSNDWTFFYNTNIFFRCTDIFWKHKPFLKISNKIWKMQTSF